MTSTNYFLLALRETLRSPRAPRRTSKRLATGAAVIAFALTALVALVPPVPPSAADELEAYISAHAQSLTVSSTAEAAVSLKRDRYSATAGVEMLIANGTNYDWAKLVLMSGGWPVTDSSVTVLVRWMRQENGANNWWNRNNPLNNGYGSGGGGGTGSYANLEVAAQKAAEMLQHNPGMSGIVAGLAASAPTATIEQAIWASPWASSHYGNGSRWHYTPVDQVKAPAGAW